VKLTRYLLCGCVAACHGMAFTRHSACHGMAFTRHSVTFCHTTA